MNIGVRKFRRLLRKMGSREDFQAYQVMQLNSMKIKEEKKKTRTELFDVVVYRLTQITRVPPATFNEISYNPTSNAQERKTYY